MELIQIDKIKLALAQMGDNFWEKVTEHGAILSEKSSEITTNIKNAFNKLAVTQMSILEVKRKGYARLVENKKKSAVAGIVKENKDRIDELLVEKSQAVTALSNLLKDLTAIIKEVQTLGEDGKNG